MVDFSVGNIKVEDDGGYWTLNGQRRRDQDDWLVVHLSDLQGVSARNLRQAYRRLEERTGWSGSDMHVVDGDSRIDVEFLEDTGVGFKPDLGNLVLTIECFLSFPSEEDVHPDVTPLIAPLLEQKGLSIAHLEQEIDDSGSMWRVELSLNFTARSRFLPDVHSDGLDVKALIEASAGSPSRRTVADLVRGGRAQALLGQPEGDWLEVKREHAKLESEGGKIQLAQWVAQFANSPDGGVLVLGMATKDQGSGDIITKVTPLLRGTRTQRKYVQAIDARIIPPIENLRIDFIPYGEGDLILIDIPPQAEENKPFLVHGAIVDGRVQGNFFSIVRRRQDEMASTHPANVHANLTVGRAFLRRGDLPPPLDSTLRDP